MRATDWAAVLTAVALVITALGSLVVPFLSRNDEDSSEDVLREQLLELLEERDDERKAEIQRLKNLLEPDRGQE